METRFESRVDGRAAGRDDQRRASSHTSAWTPIGENCWRNGDHTIVRYGTDRGWRFELWKLKEQGMGNFKSFEAAVAHYEQNVPRGEVVA